MIAGQIRRLSSALEPLPGNNKCLGNQKGWGWEGRGGAWESDCSILETPTTQRTVENSQLGDKKTKRCVNGISWPLATRGTNRNRELGVWGCVREDVGGGGGQASHRFLLGVKNVLIPDNKLRRTN